jgi:O-antigen ligase
VDSSAKIRISGILSSKGRLMATAWGIALAIALLAFVRLPVGVIEAETQRSLLLAFDFATAKWIAATILVLLWLFSIAAGFVRFRLSGVTVIDSGIVLLVCYSALSLLWAPDLLAGTLSLSHVLVVLAVYVAGRLSGQDFCLHLLRAFGVASVFGICAISLRFPDPSVAGGLGNENFQAEAMAVAAALCFSFSIYGLGWGLWLVRTAAVGGLAYLIFVPAANLQFFGILGGAIFVFAFLGRPRTFVAAGSVVGILGAGVLVALIGLSPDQVPLNVSDRLQIWVAAARVALDAPLFGHGLGSLFHKIGPYTDYYLNVIPGLGSPAYDNFARQADAADNDYLQLWAEVGLVGVGLGVASIIAVYRALFNAQMRRVAGLGFPLTTALFMAIASQTLQNPATAIPVALIVAVLSASPAACPATQSSNATLFARLLAVGGFALVLGVALTMATDLQVALRVAKADAFDQAGLKAQAAKEVLLAGQQTVRDPRSRLRLYSQTMVAGPSFWQQYEISPAMLDALYERSSTAATHNPLLLDLRLKQILSTPGQAVNINAFETMLLALKRRIGDSKANPHVLEAAFALQINDLPRARRALSSARSLLHYPLDPNDQTNKQNIDLLSRQIH